MGACSGVFSIFFLGGRGSKIYFLYSEWSQGIYLSHSWLQNPIFLNIFLSILFWNLVKIIFRLQCNVFRLIRCLNFFPTPAGRRRDPENPYRAWVRHRARACCRSGPLAGAAGEQKNIADNRRVFCTIHRRRVSPETGPRHIVYSSTTSDQHHHRGVVRRSFDGRRGRVE